MSEEWPALNIGIDDIRRAVSFTAFRKAQGYQFRQQVLWVRPDATGRQIDAQVQGSRKQPYDVSVRLNPQSTEYLRIDGTCSCPMRRNCKHVAAALLVATERRRAWRDANRAGNGNPQSGVASQKQQPALPLHLAAWVEKLVRLERSESEDYPPDVRQRLLYVLDLDLDEVPGDLPALVAHTATARVLEDGSFSDRTARVDPRTNIQASSASYLRPSDRYILSLLSQMRGGGPARDFTVMSGREGAVALDAMIATGRTRWQSASGPTVRRGPPRKGRIFWRLTDAGERQAAMELEGNPTDVQAVLLAPPWYIELNTGVMGPVELPFAPRVAAAILSAPTVPYADTEALRVALAERLPALKAIELPKPESVDTFAAPLVPCLKLFVVDLDDSEDQWDDPPFEPDKATAARLVFRYGETEIERRDPRQRPASARGGRIVEIVRDHAAEAAAIQRLRQLGFMELELAYGYRYAHNPDRDLTIGSEAGPNGWKDFLYEHAPRLRAEGWQIEIDRDFPVHLVAADSDIDAEIAESSGIDWFELDLGVMVDGERIDLVPALLAALRNERFSLEPAGKTRLKRPIYLPLPDGRTLAVPGERLRPFVAALQELFAAGVVEGGGRKLRLSALDAGSLADLEAATAQSGLVWTGGENVRRLGQLLRDAGGIARATVPRSFKAELRPYQARGVDWLQFLRSAGLGGILADDMGLGKTVQTLAHIAIEKAEGRLDRPVLVVMPTSLIPNWRREAQQFTPHLKVLTLHGADRKARFAAIASHDLVLTTYALIGRDHPVLGEHEWHLIVLDEAQTIKNPAAIRSRLVGQLKARHRLCLSGTPLENHLGNLWSLFAFLSPGFLGDQQDFNKRWRTPIEKRGDAQVARRLSSRVRPFLLRRTKAEVAVELPPKSEIVEAIEMESAQRDLYETIRLAMHSKIRDAIAARGLARSKILVLDALLKLRQVCCDPRLLKLETASAAKAGSAKLERLMEMLPDLIAEGRRVLLFSQFTSMLALIEEALGEASIPYVVLTGDTRDRETPIRRFQDGEVPLFLISLKAGGLGLNLTAADTVIHYDPWWNPAVEDQATDRAHRIGQTKPVFVHKFLTLGSIEEKMEGLKARKRDLAASLFDPAAGAATEMTEADVEALLGPS